jgi:hypothetical protein
MTFAAPWVLAAFALLPLLWWLLRVTPPAPRSETFPALRLLLGLHATEETPARTPWWLLALRLAAAGLVIIGMADPVLDSGARMAAGGPLLLVIDNGWASAAGWPRRMQAATAELDRAGRAGRTVALLTTTADGRAEPPRITPVMPVADLRPRLAAVHPEPWTPDRAAAAASLRKWRKPNASVVYIGDGLTDGDDFPAFSDALRGAGAVTQVCCDTTPPRVLLPPAAEADRMVVRVTQRAQPAQSVATVLAQTADGRTLAQAHVVVPAGASAGSAGLALPLELRNQISRLVLEGPPSAASVVLLDERWRRRPVGLLSGDQITPDSPFAGALYYLRRALEPYAELRTGNAATLVKGPLSVLILADRPLPPGPERDAIAAWVDKGGLLIRFAGPHTAEEASESTDPLMPVTLLSGDRQLGGALSWNQPAGLAPFPADSPFAGLPVPDDVKINRQVLAEPNATLGDHSWATLADGTPLVTQAKRGAGRVVLFHVTSNADWSNLPLSGLFVDMLRRLIALSVGVAPAQENTVLAPASTLDGFGLLIQPPQAATGLAADAFDHTAASPRHPPGLYGPENNRRALNLGTVLPPLAAAPPIPGARLESFETTTPGVDLGPWAVGTAVVLLLADMLIALGLRGLLRGWRSTAAALLLATAAVHPAHALDSNPNPALATRLGYVVSGDSQVDAVSKAGLEGLSEYVNRRTAATLVEPDPIEPGRTDLSEYPLIYWPLTPDAPTLTAEQTAALNTYMNRGGIILIDTRDSGSGAGFAPGTESALRRVARGLDIPPLAPLTTDHVLARAFYLLSDFPGRYTGDTVWVMRDQDRTNDSVSPVIIGGNDWAAAWAVDADGRNPYAVIPGGQRQRTLAYRFGVNLVMYALTGNYKGDQVHVPAILQRLGQ